MSDEKFDQEPMTMDQAMAGEGSMFKQLKEGDVVDGVVVHIDKDGVLVDVGTKSEGVIRPDELDRDRSLKAEDVVSVGDTIKVYVIQADNSEGGPLLSKKRANFESAWLAVEKAYENNEYIKAMVLDRVKGGLVVDLGIRGFVPGSHVGNGKLKNLDKFVGQSMTFKVIEVDRERRKVVLSNREAAAEEAAARKKETLAKLAEGVIVPGVIRRLTDYGAFVDLGGVDGLLHISEMSWTRIKHPSDILKVGQKIQVMVLKMNMDDNRISLGLRQILPDPWVDVCKKYSVGDVVKGTVTRVVPFGAFVAIEGGVEGIIPNSELAYKRFNRPDDIVSAGQELEVKIIDLRAEERRMSLSLKRMQPAPERPERPERPRREKEESDVDKYRAQQEESGENKTTIGDLLGSQLKDLAVDEAAEAPAEEAAPVVEEAPAAAEAPVEEAPAVEEAPTEEAPAEESAE